MKTEPPIVRSWARIKSRPRFTDDLLDDLLDDLWPSQPAQGPMPPDTAPHQSDLHIDTHPDIPGVDNWEDAVMR